MAWQGTLIALAVGGVVSLVASVWLAVRKSQMRRNMNQSYQTNSFLEEHQERSPRNITCPFCNKFVNENDHRLPCGHRYHRSCYQSRSANNRKCTYCQDSNEGGTTSSAQSSRRSSIVNECCYCKSLILNAEGFSILNCNHITHKECYIFKDIMQCQACNANRY
ncbi:uncharacterized protein [Chelonus insularis]|uniref:uncharacterized protein n=1 Tax=Chelonus insularis TaxID=460826 RepID=UPI001589F9DB|nr:uncharacterized protein LOC118073260 [Chelonus insularis]